MRKPWTLIGISVLLATLAVAAIACSSGSKKNTSATQTAAYHTPKTTQTSTTPKATQASPTPKATVATTAGTPSGTTTVIATQNTQLGYPILTDAAGKTLYKYAHDAGGVSSCADACAQAWPPLTIAAGTPTAGTGVTGALGTTPRVDGTTQVTYNGSPLYYFAGDVNPGDATGNGVNNFSVISLAGG